MDIRGFRLTEAPEDFIDDPYPYYAALRESSPVHELESGSYFVSRYEDVVAVYRHAGASSDKKIEFKPKFGDSPLYEHHTTSLVFNDPPLHTRVRSLVMGALNQRAIARMEAGVATLVDKLLDEFSGEVDFINSFAARIPVEVIGNLLDIPRDERGSLRAWSIAILSGLEPRPTPEMLVRGNLAVKDFKDYLSHLVEARRKRPGDYESDVLTRLIQGEKDGARLSALELYHNCIFLLNADDHESHRQRHLAPSFERRAIFSAEKRARPHFSCNRGDASLRGPDPAQQPQAHREDQSLR
jgi:cytochrome P450